MAQIAVFGGTFNPFHIGHYKILETLCAQDKIDEVLVMPDRIPPHKVCDFLASDEHRIEMCRIVCKDFSKAKLSLLEFEREGKSYTVYTARELKKIYPDDKLYFVCGGDMIASLDKWFNFEELFTLISFIAFRRQGIEEFDESVKRMRRLGADIWVIDADIPEISSSELRRDMTLEMLPDGVAEYIKENGVYDARNT